MILEIKHPAIGAVKSIANPVKLSGTPVVYRLPPPRLGEHTEAILAEGGWKKKRSERRGHRARRNWQAGQAIEVTLETKRTPMPRRIPSSWSTAVTSPTYSLLPTGPCAEYGYVTNTRMPL